MKKGLVMPNCIYIYVLKTVQKAIENQNQIIRTTEELKRALMKRLFTKGLDPNQPTKMTEIGEIPAHWELFRLGELGELKYGYTTSATDYNTGVKFLRITDIQDDGRIIWDNVPYCDITAEEYSKYHLKPGDIVFARIGATSGKTGFIDSHVKSVFASYLIRFRTRSSLLFPRFLFYFTQSEKYWKIIIQEREDKLKKGINATMLSDLLIPLPPTLEEQRKIANILLTVDRKIELAQQKREALEELFSTLRYKLMTGQIRANELKTPDEV
jgi:type I restriction enzyme S subunit